jgi:membrane-associated phospholipid phosphatase
MTETTTPKAAPETADQAAPDRHPIFAARDDITVERSDIGWLIVGLVVLIAVFFALGELVVSSDAITSFDQRVAEWFVDRRTPALDTVSLIGSYLAETIVKIVATAVLAIGMWLAWKRWREPLLMVLPLILEATAFITITFLVGRSRPDVERLDSSPVGSSFPSGHVAAAAAYGALAIIVFWHTRSKWIRLATLLLIVAIPVIVGASRMYRGMHFLSDVIAGAALGVLSVALGWFIVHRMSRRSEAQSEAQGR